MSNFLRRIILLGFWPITDLIVTLIANFTLVTFGTTQAILLTICIGTILNIVFLYLLTFEKEVVSWMRKHVKKISIARYHRLRAFAGETIAVITAYILSGPAMVGAPLIWLFGIREKKAYILAFIGITLNSIIWVGGVYNVFWAFIRATF